MVRTATEIKVCLSTLEIDKLSIIINSPINFVNSFSSILGENKA